MPWRLFMETSFCSQQPLYVHCTADGDFLNHPHCNNQQPWLWRWISFHWPRRSLVRSEVPKATAPTEAWNVDILLFIEIKFPIVYRNQLKVHNERGTDVRGEGGASVQCRSSTVVVVVVDQVEAQVQLQKCRQTINNWNEQLKGRWAFKLEVQLSWVGSWYWDYKGRYQDQEEEYELENEKEDELLYLFLSFSQLKHGKVDLRESFYVKETITWILCWIQ